MLDASYKLKADKKVVLIASCTAAANWLGCSCPPPAQRDAGDDSDPSSDISDLFHAQSLDTGCGVLARSWQANRDVDVSYMFLG